MDTGGAAPTKRNPSRSSDQIKMLTAGGGAVSFHLMNRVLSLLLAFIFLHTQAWALSGGPVFGGTAQTSLIGTYAGALLPTAEPEFTDPAPTAPPAPGAPPAPPAPTDPGTDNTQFNGLGLFTLSVPDTGLGTGTFVYFSEGRTFTGTITGLADPERQTLIGLVKGQFDIIVDSIQISDDFFGDASLQQTVPGGFANGTIKAEFTAGNATALGVRLEGEAQMEISEFRTETVTDDNGTPADATDDIVTQSNRVETTSTLILVVDGFQQSTQAGGTTDFSNFAAGGGG